MSEPVTNLRHPLWIPGQLYPSRIAGSLVNRGSNLTRIDSLEDLTAPVGRPTPACFTSRWVKPWPITSRSI